MEETKQLEDASERSSNGSGLSIPRRVRKRRKSIYGDNPIEYYREHCYPMPRGKLSVKHKGLYAALRRAGQLKHVPFSEGKYGKNPIEYYREHCSHLTRGQLLTGGYGALYQALKRKGQLEDVPLSRKLRSYGDNPIEYYREHCSHLTRSQLRTNGHWALYRALKRKGQLEDVPLGIRDYGGSPIEYL